MSPTTVLYIAQAIHGLAYGMLLFLIASGLTLIFGMMGILNIAHASFAMLSAYFCFTVTQLTGNFWLSLLIAPVAAGICGVVAERFLLRPVHKQGHLAELLLTVGLMTLILEIVKWFWGTESLVVAIPTSLNGLIHWAGLIYPVYRLFIIGISLLVLAFMAFILFKTRLGMIVRAAVSDPEMVSALGINTPLVFMAVFGIGIWLAGIAGAVAGPLLTVFPGMADLLGMDAFVVVVVGGFGSLGGAFIVALFLGELNAYGIQFIPRLAPVLMFTFMALVLAFKPMGLFGERE
jgi:branched-chain amino acid transport system permease protein